VRFSGQEALGRVAAKPSAAGAADGHRPGQVLQVDGAGDAHAAEDRRACGRGPGASPLARLTLASARQSRRDVSVRRDDCGSSRADASSQPSRRPRLSTEQRASRSGSRAARCLDSSVALATGGLRRRLPWSNCMPLLIGASAGRERGARLGTQANAGTRPSIAAVGGRPRAVRRPIARRCRLSIIRSRTSSR
jgi:hypothetical protein